MSCLIFGGFVEACSRYVEIHNGAVPRQIDGDLVGFDIPAYVSGKDSYVKFTLPVSPFEAGRLKGGNLRVRMLIETSAGYDQRFIAQPETEAGPIPGFKATRWEQMDDVLWFAEFEFIMPAAWQLSVTVQARDDSMRRAAAHLAISDVAVFLVDATNLLRNAADIAAELSAARCVSEPARSVASADGILPGGLFEAPETVRRAAEVAYLEDGAQSIMAAAMDGPPPSLHARLMVKLGVGTWRESGINSRACTDIMGTGQGKTIIDGSLSPDTDLRKVSAISTIELQKDHDLQGLTVIGKNCRYAVHADHYEGRHGIIQIMRDCTIIHEGNDEAMAYRESMGGNRHEVWPHTAAIGGACYNGGYLEINRCTVLGDRLAVAVHNRVRSRGRSVAKIHNTTLSARQANGKGNQGRSLEVFSFGSAFADVFELVGCTLNGDIRYFSEGWHVPDLSYQPANHQEWELVGHSNSPCVVEVDDFGRALKIEAAAPLSKVRVEGSAVDVLFGRVTTYDGVPSIAGYAYGEFDIQDRVGVGHPGQERHITGIGKRLGDCSNQPLDLRIYAGDRPAIEVVFDADYRNVSNAEIIFRLNAALGSAATASEYNIGARYRPKFRDEECIFVNETSFGIPMGTAVAYGSDGTKYVRTMTENDATHLFAGIAWEDVYPGQAGRVKTSGYLSVRDIARADCGALAVGEGLAVADSSGRVARSDSRFVLRSLRSDAVAVGGR